MNYIIHIHYKNHHYNFTIANYSGEIIAEGNFFNKTVNEVIKSFHDKNINTPKWFINKANEAYVWDINNKTLELGDWGCSFIIEGGYLEDWGDCYNI